MDPATLLVSSVEYKQRYDAAANLKIAFVAAAAVGVWDWLVTLNEERRYIWPRRLSLVKIAFLLNRYYFLFAFLPLCGTAVFHVFDDVACTRSYWWVHPFSCVLTLLAPQVILIFRVSAIYNWNRLVMAALGTLVVLAQVTAMVILSRLVPLLASPGISGCGAQAPGGYNFVWTFWLPSALVEVVAVSLVLGRYLSMRSLAPAGSQDLMARLLVDSLLYFAPVASITVANILFFALNRDMASMALVMYPMVALSVLLSSRLVLSLHADMLDDGSEHDSGGSLQSRMVSFIKGDRSPSSSTRGGPSTPSSTHKSTPSVSRVVVVTETATMVTQTSSTDFDEKKIRFSEV